MALSDAELNKKYGISDAQAAKEIAARDARLNQKYGVTGGALPTVGQGEALARGAGQGVTLGLSPYLQAAGSTIGQALAPGPSLSYSENLDRARQAEVAAQQAHPGTYLGGELAGSIPTFAAGEAGLARLLPGSNGFTRGMMLNTGAGGLAGATQPTGGDLTQTGINTALGAGMGAGLGLVTHGALALGKAGYNAAKTTVPGLFNTDTAATNAFKSTATQAFNTYDEAHNRAMGQIKNELNNALAAKPAGAVAKANNAKKISTLQSIVDNPPESNTVDGPGTYGLNSDAATKYQAALRLQMKNVTGNKAWLTQADPITPADVHQNILDNYNHNVLPPTLTTLAGGAIGTGLGSMGGGLAGSIGAGVGMQAGHMIADLTNQNLGKGVTSKLSDLGNVGQYYEPELRAHLGIPFNPPPYNPVKTPIPLDENGVPTQFNANSTAGKAKFNPNIKVPVGAPVAKMLTHPEIQQATALKLAAAETPDQKLAREAASERFLNLGGDESVNPFDLHNVAATQLQNRPGMTPDQIAREFAISQGGTPGVGTQTSGIPGPGRAPSYAEPGSFAAELAKNPPAPLTKNQQIAKDASEMWTTLRFTPEQQKAVEWMKAQGGQYSPPASVINEYLSNPVDYLPVQNANPSELSMMAQKAKDQMFAEHQARVDAIRQIPVDPYLNTASQQIPVGPTVTPTPVDFSDLSKLGQPNQGNSGYQGAYGVPGSVINTGIQQGIAQVSPQMQIAAASQPGQNAGSRLRALISDYTNAFNQ